ncbi:hypothetical protein [Sphingomonas sp.]|uniref:hypothetical protein n=1 Tax=Sphingomonas sp. TaxID=28214 RepID=UPI000DB8A308|nr:hypothetical protein [Sphingomonas sp.]PZU08501.1 MAG: hypothetical protein DI605_11020 [Sphingomonas sp.]
MTVQILFAQHLAWMPLIAERIDPSRYAGSFAPLEHVDLDAFDAVVPFGLADYEILSTRADLEGRRFLRPADDVVALCNDKLELARHLIRAGFERHIPAVGDVGDLPFPLIRRPRRDEFGRGARIFQGPAPAHHDPALFDQAYVPGADEYVLHAIRHRGRIRFAWALHHRMAGPGLVRGGANAPIESREIDPRPALAAFEPMLTALGYSGTCSIDFKIAGDVPVLLEINPRVGGSLTLGINAYIGAYLDCLAP